LIDKSGEYLDKHSASIDFFLDIVDIENAADPYYW
jgi:hypothetical protein